MSMPSAPPAYPARLEVEYSDQRNRLTTFFRVFLVIPIAIVYEVLTMGVTQTAYHKGGDTVTTTSGGIVSGLFLATLLMILFRQSTRAGGSTSRWSSRVLPRIGAFFVLLADKYPSTVEQQAVQLDIVYPDAEQDLNRWLPLVKWFLAIPHYMCSSSCSAAAVRGHHRVVRDPLHRPLPARALRLRGGRAVAGAAGPGLCVPPADDRYPPFSLD